MSKVIEGKQKNQEKFLVKTMLRDEMFFFLNAIKKGIQNKQKI
jgi:hypothetical protein